MDWRSAYHQNYLASMMESTAPPPPSQRPGQAMENHPRDGPPPIYPSSSSDARQRLEYSRPSFMTSYPLPPNQDPRYMQVHPANMHPAQAAYYQSSQPISYPGQSFPIAPVSQYNMPPRNVLTSRNIPEQTRPAVTETQRQLTEKASTPEIDSPTRRIIGEIKAEDELDQKPLRSSRRTRKTRKLTPVLVFDNDSDDGDYQEDARSTKRKKVHSDSEGAIDAEGAVGAGPADETESARSMTEEAEEPAEPEEVEELRPKPRSFTNSRRKRARKASLVRKNKNKTTTSDAKAKAEKASSLLKRKGKGRPIPKTVEECDEADLMMWQWKHNGRSWKDIREEWVRIMGVQPGRSSLSVRLAKMEDNFIDNGASNVSFLANDGRTMLTGNAKDLMILRYKEVVEAELEDFKWQKVAQKIQEERKTDLKPAVIRKRFNELKENGWVVGSEVQGGQDESMTEVGAAESGDEKHDVEQDEE